ncbi:MAG: hypothetical protein HY769_03975 [Candidatus Stahlbacteria bacterium]|nr:hypothetical protein [Candidatus Stahlbacteria bacterium]
MELTQPLGNALNQPIKEIWGKTPFLKDLRSLKKKDLMFCKICKYKNYCVFCYANNFIWNKGYKKPYPYQCKIAQIKYSLDKKSND